MASQNPAPAARIASESGRSCEVQRLAVDCRLYSADDAQGQRTSTRGNGRGESAYKTAAFFLDVFTPSLNTFRSYVYTVCHSAKG